MTLRAAAILLAVAAALALGTAYFAQDVLRLYPCPLCLWERWPYRIVIALGLLAAFSPRAGAALLWLAVPVLLAGAAIAFTHVGVEHHWWPSPLPECNGILAPGAPLPLTPAKPCDEPIYLIPNLPVSMAAMDFIAAIVLAVLLGTYLLRPRAPRPKGLPA